MSGLRFRRDLLRALLWGAALLVAATSLTYTALWLYFNDPLATTMSEDLGLPRERLLQPRRQMRERGALAGDRGRERGEALL